ncbi:hypothetical protein [Pandoraea aquatica]|uniref:hypothetical protein n=1 Tax=Pandoraea aquatica TaxID=2508290 RepID=UPI00124212AC|nr:hypothetical protein [Pandoraea aquatica]
MASIKWIGVIKANCKEGGEFEIQGSGFTGASEVYFIDAASKKIPASNFTVVSDEQIDCSCPPFSQSGPARGYVIVDNEEASPVKNPPRATSSPAGDRTARRVLDVRFLNVTQYTEYGNEFSVAQGY